MSGKLRLKIAEYFDSLTSRVDLQAEILLASYETDTNDLFAQRVNLTRTNLIQEIKLAEQRNLKNLDSIDTEYFTELDEYKLNRVLFQRFCFLIENTDTNYENSAFAYLILVDGFLSSEEIDNFKTFLYYSNRERKLNETNCFFEVEKVKVITSFLVN